jgi:hypothetical protein
VNIYNAQKKSRELSYLIKYYTDVFLQVKEEYLVKSNQVWARMEMEISDCQPTIAQNVLYIVIRT